MKKKRDKWMKEKENDTNSRSNLFAKKEILQYYYKRKFELGEMNQDTKEMAGKYV